MKGLFAPELNIVGGAVFPDATIAYIIYNSFIIGSPSRVIKVHKQELLRSLYFMLHVVFLGRANACVKVYLLRRKMKLEMSDAVLICFLFVALYSLF